MRLNKYLSSRTDLSRRSADAAIQAGKVYVNGQRAAPGQDISPDDQVHLNGKLLTNLQPKKLTIIFNKPAGYVCSRVGQGSHTIYDILPQKYVHLNPAGRLDKYSSGLLLLTNDGELAQQLTHPKNQKIKIYEIELDKDLAPLHQQMISDNGITLKDGISRLQIEKLANATKLRISMQEGRNRQIRRTFDALGYEVVKLHRTQFGPYRLDSLEFGRTKEIT